MSIYLKTCQPSQPNAMGYFSLHFLHSHHCRYQSTILRYSHDLENNIDLFEVFFSVEIPTSNLKFNFFCSEIYRANKLSVMEGFYHRLWNEFDPHGPFQSKSSQFHKNLKELFVEYTFIFLNFSSS